MLTMAVARLCDGGVGLWFIGDVIFALNESLWRHDDTVAASDVIALSCAG